MRYMILGGLALACAATASLPAHADGCLNSMNNDAEFRKCLMMESVGNSVTAFFHKERTRICVEQPRGDECRQFQAWEAERQAYLRERDRSR